MKKGFRTVVVANSAKTKWAKVASEASDLQEGGCWSSHWLKNDMTMVKTEESTPHRKN